MQDLAGKISELMSNPDVVKQIQDLINLPGDKSEKKSQDGEKRSEEKDSIFSGLSPDAINTIMKVAPLMASVNEKDKYTNLLWALRPLLAPPRQEKLDKASKILKMLKFLPILKKQGLL